MATFIATSSTMVICEYIVCIFLALLGAIILWKIVDGSIDLSELLEEANGGASMSRFQLLIFTFVFAFSLFLVVSSTSPMSFPNIPGTVLSLLGISGSSYLVSKGIQFSDPAGIRDRGTDIVINPVKATVAPGKTQQFTADAVGKPDAKLVWEKTRRRGHDRRQRFIYRSRHRGRWSYLCHHSSKHSGPSGSRGCGSGHDSFLRHYEKNSFEIIGFTPCAQEATGLGGNGASTGDWAGKHAASQRRQYCRTASERKRTYGDSMHPAFQPYRPTSSS